MIPQKVVDEVLSIARIEEVIEDFVNLKRRGVNLIGNCPFHDEKTPSFTVSPSKGLYKCFGCGKGGTTVSFVMEHESLSFVEAIKYLGNKYNIEVQEVAPNPEEVKARQLTDSLYIVNDFSKNYYTDRLFNSDEGKSIGLSYFKQRGFLESTIKKFDLGFSTTEKDGLTKAALEKQFNIEHLKLLGLTNKNDGDFFRDRVMFSIHSLSGKVIAFAGRTLSNDKTLPKYVNSPETELYNKRKILYGMFHAKNSIRKEDECIMVEGYTDVITLHQAGIENVVASSGTSLTVDQIRLVKRFTDNIKIIYDGDAAGIKAALRGLDLVLEEDLNVMLVLLPDGEDPDSYLKKVGTEAFKTFLKENEKDFILFKTDLLAEETKNNPIKRAEVLNDIVDSIAKIPNAIKRSTYIQFTSQRLDIAESILTDAVAKSVNNILRSKKQEYDRDKLRKVREGENTVVSEKKEDNTVELMIPSEIKISDEWQERDIIRILICGCEKPYEKSNPSYTIADYLIDNITDILDTFNNDLYKKILNEAKTMKESGQVVTSHYFTHHEEMAVNQLAIDLISSPYQLADWEKRGIYFQSQKPPEENYAADAFQAITRLKWLKLKSLIDIVTDQINNATAEETSSEEYILNIQVLQELIKERKLLSEELNLVVYP